MRINDKHLAYFASIKDAPDKEGWLWKKGEVNTSYQKRWCVLRGNLLFYFDKRMDKDPIGVIVLEDCSVQLAEGGDSAYTFSIQFSGEGTRTYKLTADDDETCMAWVKILSSCSYRYVELLVEELERELKTLQLQSSSGSSKKLSGRSSASRLEFNENHFSSLAAGSKACSVGNIVDKVEHDDTEEDLLKFDAFSSDQPSPRLGRSKSTNEISQLNTSLTAKDKLSSKLIQKSSVMTKLSPRLGRKKNNKHKPGEIMYVPAPKVIQDPYQGTETLTDCYRFLELHNQYRRDIEKLTKKIESTV